MKNKFEIYIRTTTLKTSNITFSTLLLSFYLKLWELFLHYYTISIYLLKVNNANPRTMCKTCSKLTIKAPERRHWRRSGVFIVNFEQVLHTVLVFLVFDFEKINAIWILTLLKFLFTWKKLATNFKAYIHYLNITSNISKTASNHS